MTVIKRCHHDDGLLAVRVEKISELRVSHFEF